MVRSQLNININPDLLNKLKKKAMKSGLTLTEFTTKIISDTLKEEEHTKTLEERLLIIEQALEDIKKKSSDD